MKRARYKTMPSEWMRVLLQATAGWPWRSLLRDDRLKMDDELNARAIGEEAEAGGAHPVQRMRGMQ